MKLLKFPTQEPKDLGDLCAQIRALMYSQPYQLCMAETIGVLEIVKVELLDEAYDD